MFTPDSLILWGAGGFGGVVGWLVYHVFLRAEKVDIKWLGSLVAVLGGGAVTALFEKKSQMFGCYYIGLCAAFFLAVLFVPLGTLAKRWVSRRLAVKVREIVPKEGTANGGFDGTEGLQFFPNRAALDSQRNLVEELQKARVVKILVVGGSALVEAQPNLTNVKKALLPHPESPSLLRYAHSVGDTKGLPGKIEQATERLLANGVSVKWYQDAVGHTLIIADPTQSFGWAQWESVLPYASHRRRPCVVVSNQQFSELLKTLDDAFEKMFEAADYPPSPTSR